MRSEKNVAIARIIGDTHDSTENSQIAKKAARRTPSEINHPTIIETSDIKMIPIKSIRGGPRSSSGVSMCSLRERLLSVIMP